MKAQLPISYGIPADTFWNKFEILKIFHGKFGSKSGNNQFFLNWFIQSLAGVTEIMSLRLEQQIQENLSLYEMG